MKKYIILFSIFFIGCAGMVNQQKTNSPPQKKEKNTVNENQIRKPLVIKTFYIQTEDESIKYSFMGEELEELLSICPDAGKEYALFKQKNKKAISISFPSTLLLGSACLMTGVGTALLLTILLRQEEDWNKIMKRTGILYGISAGCAISGIIISVSLKEKDIRREANEHLTKAVLLYNRCITLPE